MAQPIQTHINAFYEELAATKQAAAEANQHVAELENAIVSRGYPLPNTDGSIPQKEYKAALSIDQGVSANAAPTAEPTPDQLVDETQDENLQELTRDELNQRASGLGIDNPQDLPNKTAVIEAINEKEGRA